MKNKHYSIDELTAFRDIVGQLQTMYTVRQLEANPSVYLANIQMYNLYYKIQNAIMRCTIERRNSLKFNLNLKDKLSLMVFRNANINMGVYEANFIQNLFFELQAQFI